jgi:hypothetical protein
MESVANEPTEGGGTTRTPPKQLDERLIALLENRSAPICYRAVLAQHDPFWRPAERQLHSGKQAI